MDEDEVIELVVRPTRFQKSMLWHVPLILMDNLGNALSEIAATFGIAIHAHQAYEIERADFHQEDTLAIETIAEGGVDE